MGCCSSVPAEAHPQDPQQLAATGAAPGRSRHAGATGSTAAGGSSSAAAAGTWRSQSRRAPDATPSPLAPHHLSSVSTDSDSDDADSDWDRYSWRRAEAARAGTVSPGPLWPQGTSLSMSLSRGGSLSTQLRLRQDSLFGIAGAPQLAPVRDSGRLAVCRVSGVTFVNQFMVIKYLGRGSSGRVFLCMSLDDHRLYAVKIIKKDQAGAHKAARSGSGGGGDAAAAGKQPGSGGRRPRRDPLDDLRAEIAVMRRALHPNIVGLREVVDDSSANKLLLVLDYLEGGPVMTREGLERGHRVPEDVARLYFRDMCKALDYLHSCRRVVHGDLKPENALLGAGGRVALSDFGCSKVLAGGEGEEEGQFDRCNGTPAFLAPEMMKPHARYRGRPADVYALGACLFSFVFGCIPFKADTVMQLFEIVQSAPLTFPPDAHASPALKQLLLGMLEKDPERRLTLPQVMAHPWITAGGALPPLRPAGRHGHGTGAANGVLPEALTSSASSGAAASPNGSAGNGQHAAQQQAEEQQPDEEQQQAADEEQQERLLRAALEGLVSGELQVQTFAAGQPLMLRGQPGAHLMYILEGECEVLYRPAPPPDATPPQPAQQAQQQQQQQQQQQRRPESTGGGPLPSPCAPAVGRQSSAAGLFASNGDAGSRPSSAQSTAAGPALSHLPSELSVTSSQQLDPRGRAAALCARANSSCIAEAAEAAADDISGQQQQEQQHQRQLSISVPAAVGEESDRPSTPSTETSAATPAAGTPALDAPRRPSTAATPPASHAALRSPSPAPTPGPYGLHHMAADIDGAAAHLQSPITDVPANGAGVPPQLMKAAAGEAEASAAEQQQQGAQGPAQDAAAQSPAAPPPEVVGEELPPTLFEAATRASEQLAALARGEREYLVGVRRPGDFIGEMEVLGGSQSRRAASVVASNDVRAAIIPYATAKAYLARHPLAKQQLAQLMWLRQSEGLVLEALSRLAALGEDMLRLLR